MIQISVVNVEVQNDLNLLLQYIKFKITSMSKHSLPHEKAIAYAKEVATCIEEIIYLQSKLYSPNIEEVGEYFPLKLRRKDLYKLISSKQDELN